MSWKLSSCRTDCDGQKVYIVNTDLSALNGLTINGIEITGAVINPDYCWQVTFDDTPSILELISYKTFYTSCDYCVCGCCTEGIPVASVCATMDLSGVDISLLGENNEFIVTFIGPTSTLILSNVTGDFTGLTLLQLITLIVNGVNTGGSGFSASSVGNSIIICTPADLGTTPVGSTVTIEFTPFYTLTDYIQNPGRGYNCHPPDTFQDLGYTCPITARPAYDPVRNRVYVPNNDLPTQTFVPAIVNPALPNFALQWLTGAAPGTPFPFTEDFDGLAVNDVRTTPIPPGFSTVLYSNPTLFICQQNVLGINYYVLAEVQSYNNVTGDLTYQVIQLQQAFTIVPAFTTLAAGSMDWPFHVTPPALSTDLNPRSWGTVNLFDVDVNPGPAFGTLFPSAPAYIELPFSEAIDSIYVDAEDAVYFLCGGLGHSGIVKVDCTTNTVVATVDFNLAPFYTISFIYNPVRQLFYVNTGNAFISKVDLNLNYVKASNIANSVNPLQTDNPYNNASAQAPDLVTGHMYNGGGTAQAGSSHPPPTVYVNAVMKIEPMPLVSQKDVFGDPLAANGGGGSTPPSPVFFFTDYLTPAQFPCTGLLTVPNPNGFYFHAANNLLFVIRDTNVANQRELQSWDVNTGLKTAVYLMPPGNTYPKKMTWQPTVSMIFVTDTAGNVFFLDPVTGQFDPSTVLTPNGVSLFSFTDDPTNFLFFGTIGGQGASAQNRIAVISRTQVVDTISGTFVGDLNCSPCVPEEPDIFVRSVPDPVKLFYQVKESSCDISVIKRFSGGFWSKVKELRYGISNCCDNINLEALWLNKQLSDLDALLVPDIDCTAPAVLSACCPWLPTQSCQLIPDPYGGNSIVGVAGEQLYFSKVVMLSNDGKIYLNDPSDITTYQRAVGFATQDAVTNQQVRILISGQLINTSWSLVPGALYYASTSGNITSTVPLTGISQVVGIALSFNTLLVEIRQPIIL